MSEVGFQEQFARLQGYLTGFYATHLINTGLDLGLFQKMNNNGLGTTVDELAAGLGLHAPYVKIWCETALAFGLLGCDESRRYSLAPHYDALLANPDDPKFFGVMQVAVRVFGKDLGKHADFMRTGSVDAYRSSELIEFSAKGAERMRAPLFITKILPLVPGLTERLADGARVLDLGCGAGVFLEKLAKAYPKSTFAGIDDSVESIKVAKQRLETHGLDHRVQLAVTRGEHLSYENDFDVVILVMVLHEIPDSARQEALTNCFRALKSGGTLVVWDFAFPNSIQDFKNPLYQSGVTDQFFEMTRGTVHPVWDELREQLLASGFIGIERRFPDESPGFYLLAAHKV